jgi:hypothetical protein
MKRWGIQLAGMEFNGKNQVSLAVRLNGCERIEGAAIDYAIDEVSFVELRACLEELVRLKNAKDLVGKTKQYQDAQPKAWDRARQLLAQSYNLSLPPIPGTMPHPQIVKASSSIPEWIVACALTFATLAFLSKVFGW